MKILDYIEKVDAWYKTADKDKVKFIIEQYIFDHTSLNRRLRNTIQYYANYTGILNYRRPTKVEKSLITGDTIVTLDDIARFALSRIKPAHSIDDDDDDDDDDDVCAYDSAGYASQTLLEEIKAFWREFDNDAFMGLVSGSITKKLDLDGGRLYLLTGISEYAFNYLYYTLNKSHEEFNGIIHNSNTVNEDIEFLYPPELYLPSYEDIDALYDLQYSRFKTDTEESFKKDLHNLIEKYSKNSFMTDKVEELKKLALL
jgi:hypothetical protein